MLPPDRVRHLRLTLARRGEHREPGASEQRAGGSRDVKIGELDDEEAI